MAVLLLADAGADDEEWGLWSTWHGSVYRGGAQVFLFASSSKTGGPGDAQSRVGQCGIVPAFLAPE